MQMMGAAEVAGAVIVGGGGVAGGDWMMGAMRRASCGMIA